VIRLHAVVSLAVSGLRRPSDPFLGKVRTLTANYLPSFYGGTLANPARFA